MNEYISHALNSYLYDWCFPL